VSSLRNVGIVVIGRNEGERFKACLASLPDCAKVVYVDSGSSDGSVAWARSSGIETVCLDMIIPFTAARARNAGFERLEEIAPNLDFVQFVDGDCTLSPQWLDGALRYLHEHQGVCAVFGRRRERAPDKTVFNFLCDVEWDVPVGPARAFGGDVLIRRDAFVQSGGYRAGLIAGEEPELCVRLRAAGWTITRLPLEMTLHDADITTFTQWWRRHQRSGFAFAAGAALHGAPPERHWVWEVRRAVTWGLMLPTLCVVLTVASIPVGGWGALAWAIFPLQALRLFLRGGPRPWRQRAVIAVFQVLSRFPEAHGVISYWLQQRYGSRGIIEYKRAVGS